MDSTKQFKLRERFTFMRPNYKIGPYAYPMFGIECGDGWFKLIWKLCEGIEKEIKRNKLKYFEVHQIKEKFGGLRFYVMGGKDTIYNLINKAEGDSLKICEDCGLKGKQHKLNEWISTLCNKCLKKAKVAL